MKVRCATCHLESNPTATAATVSPDMVRFVCHHCQAQRIGYIVAGPDFDGETYERERDQDRLRAQLGRVRAAMADGDWHTLPGLSAATGDPEASVSARLRDLRKDKFGGHIIERSYVGGGLWQYRMDPPE